MKTATCREVITGKRGKEKNCPSILFKGQQWVDFAPFIIEILHSVEIYFEISNNASVNWSSDKIIAF